MVILFGDLNAKVMRRHALGNRKNNGGRFADVYNYHCLVICDALFEHRGFHKVSCISTNQQPTSNQIDHIAFSDRFSGCNIGFARHQHLNVAYLFRFYRTTAHQIQHGGFPWPYCGQAVWKSFWCANNPSWNIDEHQATIKSASASGWVKLQSKSSLQDLTNYGNMRADPLT